MRYVQCSFVLSTLLKLEADEADLARLGCEDQVASSTVGGRKAPVQRLLYIVFNKSGNQKASAACAEASPLTLPVPFPQLSSLSACTNLF